MSPAPAARQLSPPAAGDRRGHDPRPGHRPGRESALGPPRRPATVSPVDHRQHRDHGAPDLRESAGAPPRSPQSGRQPLPPAAAGSHGLPEPGRSAGRWPAPGAAALRHRRHGPVPSRPCRWPTVSTSAGSTATTTAIGSSRRGILPPGCRCAKPPIPASATSPTNALPPRRRTRHHALPCSRSACTHRRTSAAPSPAVHCAACR